MIRPLLCALALLALAAGLAGTAAATTPDATIAPSDEEGCLGSNVLWVCYHGGIDPETGRWCHSVDAYGIFFALTEPVTACT